MNDGGPAFPAFDVVEGKHAIPIGGMTLRDYFAAKALEALLSNDFKPSSHDPLNQTIIPPQEYVKQLKEACKCLCRDSYWFADEMLKARESK
jgi:hypothetical protein